MRSYDEYFHLKLNKTAVKLKMYDGNVLLLIENYVIQVLKTKKNRFYIDLF